MNAANAAMNTANADINTTNINHDHDINQAMVTMTNTATAATANNDVGESLSSIIGHLNAANTQAELNTAISISTCGLSIRGYMRIRYRT
jgi:hypothetical protein